MLRWIALFASFAFAAIVIWFVEAQSFYGEICNQASNAGHKECTSNHIALVALWHIGKFLNDWGIALTAAFTFAVAIFTWRLWGSTAELVERSDQTAKSQERAYVYAKFVGRVEGTIGIQLGNLGKTPATVDRVAYRAVIFPGEPWEMPIEDDFRRVVVIRETIPPNDSPDYFIAAGFDMSGTQTIAFYGRVFYKDVFGDNWSTAWALRLEPTENWRGYSLKGHGGLRHEGKDKA